MWQLSKKTKDEVHSNMLEQVWRFNKIGCDVTYEDHKVK